MLKGICKHLSISISDQDLLGPLTGLSIKLDYGLNFNELVEKMKVIKVKKKKGKQLNLSHDYVSTNKIPVKIKSP